MSKLFFFSVFFGGIIIINISFGQEQDHLLVLDTIEINDTRLEVFSIGEKVEDVAADRLNHLEYSNLSELLTRYSGANVRSYGPGGLSTAAVRGTGSNHTAVFWEGINLQSPANGSVDLTLVPVSFIDKAVLQYGGSSSLFGSGTLGGGIHLESNSTGISSGFSSKIIQQVGSFGSAYSGVDLRFRDKKVTTTVRGFVNNIANDFSYYNRFLTREKTQENASVHQKGLLAEAYLEVDEVNAIDFKYWLQDNLVHLSSAASAGGISKASQSDLFHRAILSWDRQKGDQITHARTAVLTHDLVYDDKLREPSATKTLSWITELESTFNLLNSFWLNAGIANIYDHAEVDGYSGRQPSRNQTALYLSSKMLIADRFEVNVSMREAVHDYEFSPFLPSFGVNYSFTNSLVLKTKIARSYRVPTFNDLYWRSGGSSGNPELKPELGWSSEIGMHLEKESNKGKIVTQVTAFSNYISNWIQWIPVRSSGWSPVNVEEVWARGIEVTGGSTHNFSKSFDVKIWGDYTFTKSTKVKVNKEGNQQEINKQLIYTPIHQGKMAVDVDYRSVTFSYSQLFIGEQFVTGDNTRTLDPYSTTDISLSHKLQLFKQHLFQIRGEVKNVFDSDYEIRNARPMPGRNYSISINYQFN